MKKSACLIAIFFICFHVRAQNWDMWSDSIMNIPSNEWQNALRIGDSLYKLAEGKNHEGDSSYAYFLNNYGYRHSVRGNYKKATQVGEEALSVLSKIFEPGTESLLIIEFNLCTNYNNLGETRKAITILLPLLEKYKKYRGEGDPSYAKCLNTLGTFYFNLGDNPTAEKYYSEAYKINLKVRGPVSASYATSAGNLGLHYVRVGDYEKAEKYLFECLAVYDSLKLTHTENYASTLGSLGALYSNLGLFSKSEYYKKKALEVERAAVGDSHPNYAIDLGNMGSFYMDLGAYGKSETLIKQAMDIMIKSLSRTNNFYQTLLNNLGVLYTKMRQYEKADSVLQAVVELRKTTLGEKNLTTALSVMNWGALFPKTGNYRKAVTIIGEAYKMFKEGNGTNTNAFATTAQNYGQAYEGLNLFDSAALKYEEGLAVRKQLYGDNNNNYATMLQGLARANAQSGKQRVAEEQLVRSSSIVINSLAGVFSFLSEQEKQSYLDQNINTNINNLFILYRIYKKDPSFAAIKTTIETQLFFKGLILDNTRSLISQLSRSRDTGISRRYAEWKGLRKELAKQYALPIARRSPELSFMEQRSEDVEKELTRMSDVFKAGREVNPVSIKDVFNSLQQDEAAIEFVRFPIQSGGSDSTMYAAFLFRKQDSIPLFIPLCEEKQLQRLFDSVGSSAQTMVNSFYRGAGTSSTVSAASLGKEIYKLVWAPIQPYLNGVKTISYSPAGKLYTIAFHAIPIDSNKLLLDKYRLRQVNSVKDLPALNRSKTAVPASVCLMGNANFDLYGEVMRYGGEEINKTARGGGGSWSALPGTAQEISKLRSLFLAKKINPLVFVRDSAKEESFRSLSGRAPAVIHLATHGYFLPEPTGIMPEYDRANIFALSPNPLIRSGIILAGANTAWSGAPVTGDREDGVVTAYEISQMDLSGTDLVVLSACETALGDIRGTEGVFGLQRGFKMAGVKKMIVSLWQVPDKETAELMTSFYAYWLNGMTVSGAFSKAQSDMRKKYSPYYWAAFVLVE